MELREEFQPLTTKEETYPSAKEVYGFQMIVKDGNLYMMIDGEWYLINNLTKVT